MNAKRTISTGIAALAVGLAGCGGGEDVGNPDSELSIQEATAPLTHAGPELAAIRDDANQLLGGGTEAFGERLDALSGTPVVVNNWASWCGPCRAEFPYFQAAAIAHGDRIAFLGIDSDDAKDAAATFLRELPLPYPSYLDPDRDLSREYLDDPRGFPATAFYDARGELAYVHQGPYGSEAELSADIERYAE